MLLLAACMLFCLILLGIQAVKEEDTSLLQSMQLCNRRQQRRAVLFVLCSMLGVLQNKDVNSMRMRQDLTVLFCTLMTASVNISGLISPEVVQST